MSKLSLLFRCLFGGWLCFKVYGETGIYTALVTLILFLHTEFTYSMFVMNREIITNIVDAIGRLKYMVGKD